MRNPAIWSRWIDDNTEKAATFVALLAGLEGLLLGGMFLRPDFLSFMTPGQSTVFVVATTIPVTIAFYVVVHFHLRGRNTARHRDFFLSPKTSQRMKLASLVLIAGLSIFSGIVATLFAFGQKGPWGYILKGITGPVLPINAVWWPVIFLLAAAASGLFFFRAFRFVFDEITNQCKALAKGTQ